VKKGKIDLKDRNAEDVQEMLRECWKFAAKTTDFANFFFACIVIFITFCCTIGKLYISAI
jgi:hypothetical protein